MISLEQFLTQFDRALGTKGIPYAIARNYDELPDKKSSGDIDFVIKGSDLENVIALINSGEISQDIKIVMMTKRSWVTNIYLWGVAWGEGFHTLQIDLITSLGWRGVPFAFDDVILSHTHDFKATKSLTLPRLNPVDEMAIGFCQQFLDAGIKTDKYWTFWQEIAQAMPDVMLKRFDRIFGKEYAHELAGLINEGQRQIIYKKRWHWCRGLLKQAWDRDGVTLIPKIIKHYARELLIWLSPRNTVWFAFYGIDGAGKTTVVFEMKKRLAHSAKKLRICHLKPALRAPKPPNERAVDSDPHNKPPRSKIQTIAKGLYYTLTYWLDYLLPLRVSKVVIYDRYMPDMLVDPRRYRVGQGKMWILRFCRLLPRPVISIFLTVTPETAVKRKGEITAEVAEELSERYKKLQHKIPHKFIEVSGEKEITEVCQEVEMIMVEALNKRIKV